MKPVYQTVVDVQEDYGTCLVQNSKGQSYPASINRLNKSISVGDEALVTKALSGEWIVIDVTHKYPAPLTLHEFPRDSNGDLNIIEHCKYLKLIETMKPSEREEFDNYLREQWGASQ